MILLGEPLDEPIQCIISDGKRIYTAAGRHIHVWKRGKKVYQYINLYTVFHWLNLIVVTLLMIPLCHFLINAVMQVHNV